MSIFFQQRCSLVCLLKISRKQKRHQSSSCPTPDRGQGHARLSPARTSYPSFVDSKRYFSQSNQPFFPVFFKIYFLFKLYAEGHLFAFQENLDWMVKGAVSLVWM